MPVVIVNSYLTPAGKSPDELSNIAVWSDPSVPSSLNEDTGIGDLDLIYDADSISPATVDFTQSVVLDRPTYRTSGLGSKDMPHILYVRSTGTSLASTFGHVGDFSFAVVIEAVTEVDGMNIYDNLGAAGSGHRMFLNEALGSLFVNYTTATGLASLGPFESGNPIIISGSINGTTGFGSWKINNGSYNTGTLTVRDLDTFTMGARVNNANLESLDSKVGDHILWTSLHTESDLDEVVLFLKNKYGVTY